MNEIEPLLDRLGVTRWQRGHVTDFIKAYNLELEGWEQLASHSCFNKKNAKAIFKVMLQFVNWDTINETQTVLKNINNPNA